MDKLFRAAEARGHRIGSTDEKAPGSDIIVDGEGVRVVVKEKLESRLNKENEDGSGRKHRFVPTGRLLFMIGDFYGTKTECGDSSRWKAEDRIEKTLDKIEAEARWRKERRIKSEQEAKEQEERWRRRKEEERRQREEQQRGEEFLEQVGRWKKAEEIRAYVALVRKLAADAGMAVGPQSDLGKRIAWAERYADRLDPLKEFPRRLTSAESTENELE